MPIDASLASHDRTAKQRSWLLFVCVVSALGGFLFGLDAIVISGAIGPVTAQFRLDSGQEGLFVSASLIGCAIGAAFASASADRFGRKPNLIAAGVITLLGVTICSFAETTTSLISSRFIGGLGVGIASMTCPLYIAETAPAHLRGRLVSLYQFAITLGILAALACNALIVAWIARDGADGSGLAGLFHQEAWRLMFGVQIPAAALFVLLCVFIPESARWLLMRGETGRARSVFLSFFSREETDGLVRTFVAETAAENKGRFVDLFAGRYRLATLITLVLATLSELSGITVIFYYGPLILQTAGADTEGALSGFAILGVVNMVATLIAIWLLDRAGRRRLLMIGTAGCAVCMVALATGLQVRSQDPVFLVGAICAFIAFYAFSIGPVKFVVVSEIFPRHLRGIGTSLGTAAVWTSGAVINQLFPAVRDGWGADRVFYFCAATLIAQFLFVWRVLPETAGKSLEEIERQWGRRPVLATEPANTG